MSSRSFKERFWNVSVYTGVYIFTHFLFQRFFKVAEDIFLVELWSCKYDQSLSVVKLMLENICNHHITLKKNSH